jgi:hypothetical protein
MLIALQHLFGALEFLSPRAREIQMLLDVQNGARIAIHQPETACHPLTTRGPSCTMDCGSSKIEEGLQAHYPLASSILEDSGPVFTNRRCGAISPVRSVPDPPASTAPRAREGIKTQGPGHLRREIREARRGTGSHDGR